MAWIESHQTLLTHRKTARLARALQISRMLAIGLIHILWWWCLDNAPEGILDGLEPADIADGAEWPGDPQQLLDALVYAGFIDKTDTGYVVHEWMDYAGKLILKRKEDAKRKRDSRLKGKQYDVHETSAGYPNDGAGNLTVPNSLVRDSTRSTAVTDTSEATDTSGYSEAFEAFWKNYPRRNGTTRGSKAEAYAVWKRMTANERRSAARGVLVYAQSDTARRDNGRFIMDAVRWLKGKGWEEYDQASSSELGHGTTWSNMPPPGFSWDKHPDGQWKKQALDPVTGTYPHGLSSITEVIEHDRTRTEQYLESREQEHSG